MPYEIEALNKPHVQRRICELRAQGMGYGTIAKVLKKLYGIQVHKTTIQKRVESDNKLKEKLRIYERDQELREKEGEFMDKLNVWEQLNEVNDLVRKFMYQAIAKEDSNAFLKCAQEILKHLEFQSKLMGEIKEAGVQYNILNLTQHITEEAKKAQEKGYTVLEPRKKRVPA